MHSCWTPLPRTLKDYISSPKPNGYRSLHTTVLVGTQPLEVQIRTQDMHNIAEFGAAAHWAYKDQAASLPWLQIIRQWHLQVDSAHEFMQLVRQELLGTRVFVFTRNGRILNLARGATLLDAAMHLDVSLRSNVPVLNGAWNAASSTELTNGDIVSFEDPSNLITPDHAAGGGTSAYSPGYGFSSRLYGQQAVDKGVDSHGSLQASGAEVSSGAEGLVGSELQQRAKAYLARRERQVGWHLCTECEPVLGDELLATSEATTEAEGTGWAAAEQVSGGSIHASGDCPFLQMELASRGMRPIDVSLHSEALHGFMLATSRAEGK